MIWVFFLFVYKVKAVEYGYMARFFKKLYRQVLFFLPLLSPF